jgi:2-polyprenyl-6-hydroxyphenyl methylase/3-demethylubiquinone-9 3-methyltransferase
MKNSHQSEVDNTIYETYGDRWYTAHDDPIALLRAESKAKWPWVWERIRERFTPQIQQDRAQSLRVLDVGCGGGFLSNALALEGLSVTGIDLSNESLKTAAKFDKTKSVEYIVADAYRLPFADASFEVVTAMDFLEHIEEPALAIKEFSRVLKPGGLFIFHTFNRNWISGLVVIRLVEWLVANTPKNMHVLRLFITPDELRAYCDQSGLSVERMIGLRPVFSSIPLRNLFSGIVPEGLRFTLTQSLQLSYMGAAVKMRSN